MKNNAYVVIDAHIIRCRLHHINSLLYSVALKSGKDQPIATDFKASKDLVIDMNTHLTLYADKHSYDQFPKLTLTVNIMNENKERKTVGTTFSNFRKQGIQTFQVSQCSCKDKAFQVDICFTTKIIEAKSSNTKTQKNQHRTQTKNNFLSQQNTPRQSKMTSLDIDFKEAKQIIPVSAVETREKLRQVKSQKAIKLLKSEQNTEKIGNKDKENLEQVIAVLNQKIMSFEKQVSELKQCKNQLQKERIKCEKWLQLLKLQQQKNGEAMRYIIQLEEIILGMMSKDTTKSKLNGNSNFNFKIIEQKDEIILMNEELQSELFKQKQKMKKMECQIIQLKLDLEVMQLKLNGLTDNNEKKQQIPLCIDHSTILNLKSEIINEKVIPQEIMITSRVRNIQDTSPNLQIMQNKKKQLLVQIQFLQSKINGLKQQIDKLLLTKENLEKQITKSRLQNKKTVIPPNKLPPKREQIGKKNQKGHSKQKNSKSPSLKTTKKGATGPVSVPVQPVLKKIIQVNNCESKTEKQTKVSTELESKTEKQESLSKGSQLIFNEVKSDNFPQAIHQVILQSKTFQQQITYF